MPTITTVLKGILNDHAAGAARRGLPALLVLGRNTDGSAQVRNDDGECIGRARTNAYTGEKIRSTDNGFTDAGASGISLSSRRGTRPLLWVESLDPRDEPTGETTTVTVTGWGFDENFLLDFLLPESETGKTIHPGIVQLEQRLISPTEVEIDIEVAADLDLFENAPIAFDNRPRIPGTETSLRFRKEDAYGLIEGVTPYIGFAYDFGTQTVHAFGYDAAGDWKKDLASHTPGVFSSGLVPTIGSLIIGTDPLGNCGNNALLTYEYTGTPRLGSFTIWDWRNETVSRYPSSGYLNMSRPTYWDGYVYWLELTSVAFPGTPAYTWNLYRATTDLGAPEVLNSVTRTGDLLGSTTTVVIGHKDSWIANGIFCMMTTLNYGSVWFENRYVAIPIDGSAGTDTPATQVPAGNACGNPANKFKQIYPDIGVWFSLNLPGTPALAIVVDRPHFAAGCSYSGQAHWPQGNYTDGVQSALSTKDETETGTALVWPNSGLYSWDSYVEPSPEQAQLSLQGVAAPSTAEYVYSLSRNGDTIAVHIGKNDGTSRLVVGDETAPSASIPISVHPTLSLIPVAFFLRS